MSTALIHWVVCDDYAAGPYTPGRAQGLLDSITTGRDLATGCCTLEHRVTVSGFKPTTGSELARLRRDHQAAALASDPFAGPDEELAALLAERVAAIMTADLGTSDGELAVAETGWTREAGDRADAAADKGSPAWIVALGAHETVTLTSDGGAAEPSRWCRCPASQALGADTWVRYERWTADGGNDAHGLVCAACRRLLQSG